VPVLWIFFGKNSHFNLNITLQFISQTELSTTLNMKESKLSRKDINAWRDFIATEAFHRGIAHLSKFYTPSLSAAGTDIQMVRNSVAYASYLKALDDVEQVLSTYPEKETESDEPTLK
jgi:hypothetical protein